MNPLLPEEAVAFGAAAERAFAALGGVDVARRAEIQPHVRTGEVRATLTALGAADLDATADLDTAAAAGELCRMAGRSALPYPVAATVLARPDSGAPFAIVPEDGRCRVDHGDLFDEWVVATPDGRARTARPGGDRLASRLGPFVTDLAPHGVAPKEETGRVLLALTLSAWQILGAVERALELAIEHVTGRVQFGQKLSAFQAVQFQLADAAVGVDGLRELCHFTLWRTVVDTATARPDALALRVHALDVARAVLRTTQQLHGAAGVCEEYDISVICRHTQPALRLPFDAERTVIELADAVDRSGFESLFPHGSATW